MTVAASFEGLFTYALAGVESSINHAMLIRIALTKAFSSLSQGMKVPKGM